MQSCSTTRRLLPPRTSCALEKMPSQAVALWHIPLGCLVILFFLSSSQIGTRNGLEGSGRRETILKSLNRNSSKTDRVRRPEPWHAAHWTIPTPSRDHTPHLHTVKHPKHTDPGQPVPSPVSSFISVKMYRQCVLTAPTPRARFLLAAGRAGFPLKVRPGNGREIATRCGVNDARLAT